MTEAPQTPPPAAPAAAPNPGKGLGIAGMVLGIVGLVLICWPYVGLPCAIVGLILSIISKKKSKAANAPTGMATAGMVLSIIAIAILLVALILVIVGVSIFASKIEEIQQDPNFQTMLHSLPKLL